MTDANRIESMLLHYPGVAMAWVARTADGALIASVLPWGPAAGRAEYGALTDFAAINLSETRFPPGDFLVAEKYLRGGIVLRQDAVVFDVGANIGLFVIFVAARCPSAQIYAFEPVPDVFAVLRQNIERRGIPARLYELGLSAHDQDAGFNFYPDVSARSCRSECANLDNGRDPPTRHVQHERKSGPPGREQHVAEVAALPAKGFEFIERHDRLRRTSAVIDDTSVPMIDLLRIGGRRAELDVLRGIESRHWPRIQQITMEVPDEGGQPTEGRLADVLALLRENGFHVTFTEPEMLAGTGRFAVQAVRPSYADDPRPVLAAGGTGRPLRADTMRAWLAELLPPEDVPDRVVIVSSLG